MDNKTESAIRELYMTEHWCEGDHMEFKKCSKGVPESFLATYSAFANTDGGVILLGVDDSGRVNGITEIQRCKDELAKILNNPQRVSSNLLRDKGRIFTMTLEGKEIMVLDIPRAEPSQRPVHLKGHISNSYFRQHESDVMCPEEMLEQMLRDRANGTQDGMLIPNSTMDDVDRETLRQYRNYMSYAHPRHVWGGLDDKELLTKLGAWKVDRASGKEGLTLAGLLFFGTYDALRDLYPDFHIDYYEYDGTENFHRRWAHRITADGTWEPNLFQFVFKVMPRLTENLRVPFKLSSNMIRQGETPAHIAVREALINAFIHADYKGIGGIIIKKTPDAIELSNPGSLLIPKEHIFQGGLTRCRNLNLQTIFRFMGLAEKAGSGMDKIQQGWWEERLATPRINEQRNPMRVTCILPYLAMAPKEILLEVVQKIGEKRFNALNVNEKIIVLLAHENKEVTLRDIKNSYNIDRAYLTDAVTGLVEKGYLQILKKPGTEFYCILQRSATPCKVDDGTVRTPDDGTVRTPDGGTQSKSEEENWRTREEMEEIILKICDKRWVRKKEIAQVLKRYPRSLQQRYLRPMVERGSLQMLYPDIQNHPRQAYRTRKTKA